MEESDPTLCCQQVAHRGTIFLDEVGDVDLQIQPKLLKVLEEKRFRRLGDVRDRQVDVRLIAATHQDIGQLVRERRFRDDLYFRISTIPLSFPALRERTEDIPTMAQYLLDKVSADLGRGELRLDENSIQALKAYSWPGNIRELKNVIERAVIMSEGKTLTFDWWLQDHSAQSLQQASEPPSNQTLEQIERDHILAIIEKCHWRINGEHGAAEVLAMHPNTLRSKMKKLGIKRPQSYNVPHLQEN